MSWGNRVILAEDLFGITVGPTGDNRHLQAAKAGQTVCVARLVGSDMTQVKRQFVPVPV